MFASKMTPYWPDNKVSLSCRRERRSCLVTVWQQSYLPKRKGAEWNVRHVSSVLNARTSIKYQIANGASRISSVFRAKPGMLRALDYHNKSSDYEGHERRDRPASERARAPSATSSSSSTNVLHDEYTFPRATLVRHKRESYDRAPLS